LAGVSEAFTSIILSNLLSLATILSVNKVLTALLITLRKENRQKKLIDPSANKVEIDQRVFFGGWRKKLVLFLTGFTCILFGLPGVCFDPMELKR